jgi:hypothetical protein
MAKRKDALDPLAQMRKDYELDSSFCAAKYGECIKDIRFAFIPGEQQKEAMNPRAQYEFNKTRPVVKSVTNDMRQNDPAIKVRAMEDGHKHLAEMLNGIIKTIEAQSQANTAYDTGGFFAASGGYGVIGINTQYTDDDAFEQDIRIEEKRDPFSIIFDCRAKAFDKRDSRRVWEWTDLDRSEFEDLYPDADMVDFTPMGSPNSMTGWYTEKTVRIVKLWKREPITKTIYQLSDGRVLDEDDYQAEMPLLNKPVQPDSGVGMQPPAPPLTLKNQRTVKSNKITWQICSGKEVLDGPHDWAGKWIPLVPVWGESVNVEGEEYYSGLVRPIKDSQRLFNWNVAIGMETLGNQPRSPLMFTAKMIEGYEEAYRNLGKDNAPGLPYNVDPAVPGGRPSREAPPAFPGGFFEASQFSADLIKSVSNVVDAPIQSKASSGKAIQAVENQQDVGNFDYIDNLARAKAFVGEILVDLIPKIYDTERQIMILGEDGKESYAQLNQSVYVTQDGQSIPREQFEQAQQQGMQIPPGQWQVINDLSQGKYAVTVTVGPNYATQRMETVAVLSQLAGNPDPVISSVAAYLIVKNTDSPGTEEMEKAMRQRLIAQGALEPGEGDQPPQQQGPSPDDQLKQAQAQKVQAETAKTVKELQQTPEASDPTLDWAKLEIQRYDSITKRMALGVDVSNAERQFVLDHAIALHDAHMQVAQHEQQVPMQGMDLAHQQQTQAMQQAHEQQMAAMQQQHQQQMLRMKPQPNGQG